MYSNRCTDHGMIRSRKIWVCLVWSRESQVSPLESGILIRYDLRSSIRAFTIGLRVPNADLYPTANTHARNQWRIVENFWHEFPVLRVRHGASCHLYLSLIRSLIDAGIHANSLLYLRINVVSFRGSGHPSQIYVAAPNDT